MAGRSILKLELSYFIKSKRSDLVPSQNSRGRPFQSVIKDLGLEVPEMNNPDLVTPWHRRLKTTIIRRIQRCGSVSEVP